MDARHYLMNAIISFTSRLLAPGGFVFYSKYVTF